MITPVLIVSRFLCKEKDSYLRKELEQRMEHASSKQDEAYCRGGVVEVQEPQPVGQGRHQREQLSGTA